MIDRRTALRRARIAALSRRAAEVDGPLRALLDARVAALADVDAQALETAGVSTPDAQASLQTVRKPSGLQALLGRLGTAPGAKESAKFQTGVPPADSGRGTMDEALRLIAAARTGSQRRQALQPAPANTGPLNSASLVHRALAVMQDVSPAYLEAFLAHVDAIAWLESAAGARSDGKPGQADRRGVKRARPGPRVR